MPNDIRKVLEELKSLVDAAHAADPEAWIKGKKMALHPPATADAIRKFFASDIGLGFPKSYGEFLAASDGVEWMWRGLHFMPTDTKRQKWVIKEAIDQSNRAASSFQRLKGEPTDQSIQEWRSKGLLYLPMSTIAAVGPIGDLLVYDHYSQDKNGEMAIGWKPSTTSKVEAWYPNILAWLQACLEKVRGEAASAPAQPPAPSKDSRPKPSKRRR